jgi:hypothetical protein
MEGQAGEIGTGPGRRVGSLGAGNPADFDD